MQDLAAKLLEELAAMGGCAPSLRRGSGDIPGTQIGNVAARLNLYEPAPQPCHMPRTIQQLPWQQSVLFAVVRPCIQRHIPGYEPCADETRAGPCPAVVVAHLHCVVPLARRPFRTRFAKWKPVWYANDEFPALATRRDVQATTFDGSADGVVALLGRRQHFLQSNNLKVLCHFDCEPFSKHRQAPWFDGK